MSSAQHTKKKIVPGAGNGLFTNAVIREGQEIFFLDHPLAYALDAPRLQDTCANCLRRAIDNGDIDTLEVKLRRCMGCKVVKYCGEDCHRESFRLGHRFECKIFSALYPSVLPNTVRLVLRLILRRQNRSLRDDDWSAFLSLQSHVTNFQAQQATNTEGLTAWQTIEVMSQATAKYSGTRESLNNIQGLIARVLVNTHTLTTPTLDPLGLCLCPQSALLNHSCIPNSHIIFSGQSLALRSLSQIEANSELTIAYVDTTQTTENRKSELLARYFFTCTCSSCIASTTDSMHNPELDPSFDQVESRALNLRAEAVNLPPMEAATQLESALELLSDYPLYIQPCAAIQHDALLNALTRQDWLRALEYALEAYFLIDPVQYPLAWHPVRVVRTWVLLRLVVQIVGLLQDGNQSAKRIVQLDVDWRVVIEGLWKEVKDSVSLSHGEGNSFVEEVKAIGQGMGIGGVELNLKNVEREWGELRKIADGLRSQKITAT